MSTNTQTASVATALATNLAIIKRLLQSDSFSLEMLCRFYEETKKAQMPGLFHVVGTSLYTRSGLIRQAFGFSPTSFGTKYWEVMTDNLGLRVFDGDCPRIQLLRNTGASESHISRLSRVYAFTPRAIVACLLASYTDTGRSFRAWLFQSESAINVYAAYSIPYQVSLLAE